MSARFIFNGVYTQYRGYVFAYGKPTEVTDLGTIRMLRSMPNFTEVKDGPKENKAPAAPVLKPRPTLTLGKRK